MKNKEMRILRSNSIKQNTTSEKENQQKVSFKSCWMNQRKLIFKKRTKIAHKYKPSLPAVIQHTSTVLSLLSSKTEDHSNIESKSRHFYSQSYSNCDLQQSKQINSEDVSIQHNIQDLGTSKQKQQDYFCYLGSIGEHLIELQNRFAFPKVEMSSNFDQVERIKSLKIIFALSNKYGFRQETTFMAFSIFHRIYLAPQFQKYQYPLIALSSLFIAAKYQQISIPKVQTFAVIGPNLKVHPETILEMESMILISFGFNLSFPSPLQFIDLLVCRFKLDKSCRQKMIQICLCSLNRLSLWTSEGSMLALACLIWIKPQVEVGQSMNQELKGQISWRIRQLLSIQLNS